MRFTRCEPHSCSRNSPPSTGNTALSLNSRQSRRAFHRLENAVRTPTGSRSIWTLQEHLPPRTFSTPPPVADGSGCGRRGRTTGRAGFLRILFFGRAWRGLESTPPSAGPKRGANSNSRLYQGTGMPILKLKPEPRPYGRVSAQVVSGYKLPVSGRNDTAR